MPAHSRQFFLPQTSFTKLVNTELPIIQAGMVYVSGSKLAAAAANAGCLGVIGAGSMNIETLEKHLISVKKLTNRPIALNVPLLYSKVEDQVELALKHGIRIFITSAGSPERFTGRLKSEGCCILHVVSHPKQALKCVSSGVDAVILEGFEAGGHNGKDELTTLVLLQQCRDLLSIPYIAAGGIGSGGAIAAALALGAAGVQIGTLFAATQESSAHERFKQALVAAQWSDTELQMKSVVPVRLLRNAFALKIKEMESQCATPEELKTYLGKGRARAGMFEGDMTEGELEIGQVVSLVRDIPSVASLTAKLCMEYSEALTRLNHSN